MSKIVEIQIQEIVKRLEKQNIKLEITDKAKKYLTLKGYDQAFGARPLKRLLQNTILDELSLLIIEHKIKPGSKVKVDIDSKGNLKIS